MLAELCAGMKGAAVVTALQDQPAQDSPSSTPRPSEGPPTLFSDLQIGMHIQVEREDQKGQLVWFVGKAVERNSDHTLLLVKFKDEQFWMDNDYNWRVLDV